MNTTHDHLTERRYIFNMVGQMCTQYVHECTAAQTDLRHLSKMEALKNETYRDLLSADNLCLGYKEAAALLYRFVSRQILAYLVEHGFNNPEEVPESHSYFHSLIRLKQEMNRLKEVYFGEQLTRLTKAFEALLDNGAENSAQSLCALQKDLEEVVVDFRISHRQLTEQDQQFLTQLDFLHDRILEMQFQKKQFVKDLTTTAVFSYTNAYKTGNSTAPHPTENNVQDP